MLVWGSDSPWRPSWSQPSPEGRGPRRPSYRTSEAIIEEKKSVNVFFTLTAVFLNSKERLGGVSAHHEPAQAILHLRFCNQQGGSSCISKGPRRDLREHLARHIIKMACDNVVVNQVLTILSLGDLLDRSLSLTKRRILERNLVARHDKKRIVDLQKRSGQL